MTEPNSDSEDAISTEINAGSGSDSEQNLSGSGAESGYLPSSDEEYEAEAAKQRAEAAEAEAEAARAQRDTEVRELTSQIAVYEAQLEQSEQKLSELEEKRRSASSDEEANAYEAEHAFHKENIRLLDANVSAMKGKLTSIFLKERQ